MPEIALVAVGAFFGGVGFALLAHAPVRSLLPCGIIAALTYLIDWGLVSLGCPEELALFAGALFGSVAGRAFARRLKMISTVFLMSAVVPMVPGLGLYRMMSLLGQGETAAGANQGVQAMIAVAMIALGLAFGEFFDTRLRRTAPH